MSNVVLLNDNDFDTAAYTAGETALRNCDPKTPVPCREEVG